MLFNSLDFAVFLPIVFALYWFVTNHNVRLQNALIVAASYVFYGWWDWRFLSLIVFSTFLDYNIGLRLQREERDSHRKRLLWTSIFINLGFLGFFKYCNFFLENFVAAFSVFGQDFNIERLDIILPVGISFYTFQTLSYTIDVYKRKLNPTDDFVAFSAFVCFFPQLVAGPIEKAKSLLPQVLSERKFDAENAKAGICLMLYGLFKKVVVADNLAPIVDRFYEPASFVTVNLTEFVMASISYAFQIYCDFSGYSDIAIGTASLFGISLMTNFKQPYFAAGAVEFWHRWHISLSTWFRDYVFIPLGGSRGSLAQNVRNIFVVFLVSGFWHGADWTFLLWGFGHFMYYSLSRFWFNGEQWSPARVFGNFIVVTLLWIPFRTVDTAQLGSLLTALGSASWLGLPFGKFVLVKLAAIFTVFTVYEVFLFSRDEKCPPATSAMLLVFIIALLGNFNHTAFVYFQF